MPRKLKSTETKEQREQRLWQLSEQQISDAQRGSSSALSAELRVLTDALARALSSSRPTQSVVVHAGGVQALVVAHALFHPTGARDAAVPELEVPAMPPEPAGPEGSGGYELVNCGWRRGNTWSTPRKGTKKEGGWINKSGNSKRDDVWVNYWEGPRGQRMHAFFLPGRNDVAFWTVFHDGSDGSDSSSSTRGRKRHHSDTFPPETTAGGHIDLVKLFLRVDLDTYTATSMWTHRSHLLSYLKSEFWLKIKDTQLVGIDELITKKMDKHMKKKALAFSMDEVEQFLHTGPTTESGKCNKLITPRSYVIPGRKVPITAVPKTPVGRHDVNFFLRRAMWY
eukprot:m51a1_g10725 hypothetical protein (338) ;mRNA; r:259900-264481